MKYLFLLILVACKNDAITYAKMLDSTAECQAIKTSIFGNSEDTAVCRVGSEVWKCEVRNYTTECQTVRVIPAEAPPKAEVPKK